MGWRGRGWFRWAPSKNPSVIRNNKDPPAPSLRIRFPGNHLLLLEAIARHNGQVIHPLRLLARETTTARGWHSSSPSPPSARFPHATRQSKTTNTHLHILSLPRPPHHLFHLSHPLSHDLYTSPVRLTAYAQHRRSVPPARVTLRHEIVVPSHSLNVTDPPPRFLTIVRSRRSFSSPSPVPIQPPCQLRDRLLY